MEPFRRLEAIALPIARSNVDTDQIVPARYLKKPRSDDFGAYLFDDVRLQPDIPLDRDAYRGAKIVVAGANFGCGSSREHAVWALYDGGFRAAIAPSFGDIFASNALKNGFLPIVLPADIVSGVLHELQEQPGTRLTVDLEAQTVSGVGAAQRFDIAPFARRCLLDGVDELGFTLGQIEQITTFERQYEK
jgi:3-isopropylmalate/(R)-2-methylmalate dehydratase small subunit